MTAYRIGWSYSSRACSPSPSSAPLPCGGTASQLEIFEGRKRVPMALPDQSRRFWRISAAGIFYQGGAAAVDSSTTIAMLGYLMKISPDDRRPAYSGYFNALVAPAALLPLVGAVTVAATSLRGVFAVMYVMAVSRSPSVSSTSAHRCR